MKVVDALHFLRPLPPPAYLLRQDTEESWWEDPGVPFRPMVRDRMSGGLIQAWPHLEKELVEVNQRRRRADDCHF